MKPNQTAPLLVTLAPALAAAPPLLIGTAIALGIYWLLFEKEDAPAPQQTDKPLPVPSTEDEPDAPPRLAAPLKAPMRRVMREDLAEALEYGAHALTRQEAVAALQALGFQKTAAYKALSPDGKFAELLEHTSDGLVEWKG